LFLTLLIFNVQCFRFPYFLPCLCISLLAIVALLASFWLPETLHKHTQDMVLEDSISVEEGLSGPTAEENSAGCLNLFTNWPLMSAIIAYCIFSLQDVAYAEVIFYSVIGVAFCYYLEFHASFF
jgi:hypothetical protein